jgi:1-aminocyclopropane-1-carboxylate deaminase/D-cysteine desulfhydrase-like pyridoxal-dependent ACC family enzyme
VRQLAVETGALFGEEMSFSEEEVLVNQDYLGGGYGVIGPGESEAIRMFARLEGLVLDPVYTGRAGAGLIDLIRKGFFTGGQQVLFWHTGGTPAIFADQYRVI